MPSSPFLSLASLSHLIHQIQVPYWLTCDFPPHLREKACIKSGIKLERSSTEMILIVCCEEVSQVLQFPLSP
ncbi:hypothetical protein MRB53_022031 [Persea americana]|uniref:Uncharacterized protein n=1 Tax=Persea americana TaxID=3435 RepID=A0ACC2L6N2_PERAE|nr:hypothetical protein MRB53_022031 [Persea americana]